MARLTQIDTSRSFPFTVTDPDNGFRKTLRAVAKGLTEEGGEVVLLDRDGLAYRRAAHNGLQFVRAPEYDRGEE